MSGETDESRDEAAEDPAVSESNSMVADELDVKTDVLAAEFNQEEWVDWPSSEDGEVRVVAEGVPDLRAAYDVIRRVEPPAGVVTVEGDDQGWAITHEGGEVTDVERTDGEYTVQRMSRLEQLSNAVNTLGVYTMAAALVTGLASFVLSTPLGLWESAGALVVGAVLFVVGSVSFAVVPGLTSGPSRGDPGEGIDGFQDLPASDRAALVATDDAKSGRNYWTVLLQPRPLNMLVAFAFAGYLGALGYANFGGIGVALVGAFYSIKPAFRLLLVPVVLAVNDEADDPYVDELLEEIHETADGGSRPTVLAYGDEDNPVHENVAMAIPEFGTMLVPLADVEKLHRDELEAVMAHEYKHVQSHYPILLSLVKLGLLYVPAVVLFVRPVSASLPAVAAGLFVYFAVTNALLAAVRHRWERQADDFAAEVTSPMGMAFGLNRVIDRHGVEADDETLLTGLTGEMYGSHPFPHRRIDRLVDHATD